MGSYYLVFVFSQLDSLRMLRLDEERAHLWNGHTGCIKDSIASVATDRDLILEEIRGNGEEAIVDATIETLLKSGMGNASLRAAHEKGVDISRIGFVRWKFLWLGIAVWLR